MSKPNAKRLQEKFLSLTKVFEAQRAFSKERDWDQFHTPKNLAMALSVEASELCEIFQWLTERESNSVMSNPKSAKQVRDELADILYYLLRISDTLGIDVEKAFWEKMEQNRKKYPVEKAKGRVTKYDAL